MSHRFLAMATASLVIGGGLTACGSDDNSSGGYCDDLTAAKASYIGLLENRIDDETFDNLLGDLHTIRDEAPADVKDDWATFSDAADRFHTALHDIGMTIDDAVAMQNDPNMETGPQMDALMDAAASLSSLRTAKAQGAIAESAQKDCDISLD
jgi:hypothetical protein